MARIPYFGGDGNDFIDGNIGVDKIFGQTGNDTFNWDPGDGSDQIEGGPGSDLMRFNGANIAENFELLAVGGKLHLTRSIANVTYAHRRH
jgi:Ca2+-binding RTX toxin-like protein